MRQKTIVLIKLLLAVALTASTLNVDKASAQSQPLVIVVRDGAGQPLTGVPIVLYTSGPPSEKFDNCVTDTDGQCRLNIPPGAYIVTFVQGWRGREFIPVEQQNSGSVTDGGIGGFGIYFEPSNQVQYVTFVIGQKDGQLVPLWDMSRNVSMPPRPFSYPDSPLGNSADTLAGIDLGPLDTTLSGASSADPDATPTGQVVIDQFPLAQPPVLVPTPTAIVSASSAETAPAVLPSNAVVLGLLALGALVTVAAAVFWLTTRKKRSVRSEKG